MSEARRQRRRADRRAVAKNQSPRSSELAERLFVVCLLLVVATVLVYLPLRNHDFINMDDPTYVRDNPMVARGLVPSSVLWALTTGAEANWHPLTWMSHMLDADLFGMRPGAHHVVSLIFHVANTLLLFGLLYRLTGAWGRSGFVAALFALHPLHVESVAWLAERKDVLSTLFWLLTTWAYAAYVKRPGTGRYLAVLALFAAGLMSKPMVVTLPFVLLLLDFWPLGRLSAGTAEDGRSGRASLVELRALPPLIWEKLPMFGMTVAASIVTFLVQQGGGATVALKGLTLQERVSNALVAYASYIGKTFWPVSLIALYPYERNLPLAWVAGSAVLLVTGSALAVWLARRRPYVFVGWFWFVGTLVPVIGFVQVGFQSMADRYTYVPLIGLFIVLAWGTTDLSARWPAAKIAVPVAGGVALAACAVLAHAQVQVWRDSEALWRHAVAVTPNNHLAQNNLGNILATVGKSDEAIEHLRETIRLKPDSDRVYNNLGFVLASRGRNEEALANYAQAIRLKPDYAEAYNNMAVALSTLKRPDEAIAALTTAVRLAPGEAEFHYHLAVVLKRGGRGEDAARHFEIAATLNPTFRKARRDGEELRGRGVKAGVVVR